MEVKLNADPPGVRKQSILDPSYLKPGCTRFVDRSDVTSLAVRRFRIGVETSPRLRYNPNMQIIEKWKQSVRNLKQELHAYYLACRDPRTPWYAKALGVCVIGYALSPIDLIPDPIPILGYLDDLVLLPLGIAAVRKLIPPVILAECRIKAREVSSRPKRKNWIAPGIMIAIWILVVGLGFIWLVKNYL
jgi:uncharacterized membrane protein YkvA (DUF1232 family)